MIPAMFTFFAATTATPPALQLATPPDRQALSAAIGAPVEPGGDRPRYNVLQVIFDTTRADHLSAYGYERETSPFIDSRLGDALVFGGHHSSGIWTVPNITSMLTSLLPQTHKVYSPASRLQSGWLTSHEIFKSQGYETAMISNNIVVLNQDRNLDQSVDYSAWLRRPDRLVADEFISFLDNRSESPFFAHVQFVAGHTPYTPSAQFDSLFIGDPYYGGLGDVPGVNLVGCEGGIDGVAYIDSILSGDYYLAQYDALLAEADFELSRIFDALETRGILDSTLIVLLGDHGELLFDEHGHFFCHDTMYEGNIRVPLIVWPPGSWLEQHEFAGGLYLSERTSHIDLLPSLLHFLRLGIPGQCQGTSALSPGHVKEIMVGNAAYRALRTDSGKVIHFGRDHEINNRGEMYDVENDPGELDNLAPEFPEQATEMTESLLSYSSMAHNTWLDNPPGEYLSIDFEDWDDASYHLFLPSYVPELFGWRGVEDPLQPGNNVLVGFMADTSQVGDDAWVSTKCAVFNDPLRSYQNEFRFLLRDGIFHVATSYLEMGLYGYHLTIDGEGISAEVRFGSDVQPKGSYATTIRRNRYYDLRFGADEGHVTIWLDSQLVLSFDEPRWEEIWGVTQFSLDPASTVLIDDLKLSK